MVMFAQNVLLWGMMAEEKNSDNPQLVPHHTPILPIDCRQVLCFVNWAVNFRYVINKHLS
jgi:hypothetical protein